MKFSLNFWLSKLSLGPLAGFYKLESKPISLEKIPPPSPLGEFMIQGTGNRIWRFFTSCP